MNGSLFFFQQGFINVALIVKSSSDFSYVDIFFGHFVTFTIMVQYRLAGSKEGSFSFWNYQTFSLAKLHNLVCALSPEILGTAKAPPPQTYIIPKIDQPG